ncbi:MAG: thiamine-phosphate kinase [Oscillatoriales cyanobacterium CG2_30_44_21]|nr:MAG: thiamine-phosphate kinase [Oscillatoriales cyanobacterium CG2_30_44_21]
MSKTASQLGEQGLLKILQKYCSPVVGDDAAPMGATSIDHQMVVTADMLVDEVHFSDRTTSPEDVGWRAAAVNLSDLAAMGAKPWGLVMSIGLPANTEIDWIEGVYRGFAECLHTYGTELVGGDTVRSPIRTLAVTAFGQVPLNRLIQRHTAKIGDALIITGDHGLSKAGLEILLHPQQYANCEVSHKLQRHHQRPIPRFDAIAVLDQVLENNQNPSKEFAVSGMDSSDGLADAITQICRASQVGIRLDWSALPIADAIKSLAGDRALDWLLYGGEDFELVLCMPWQVATNFVKQLPNSQIIGEVIDQNSPDNHISKLEMRSTFQHF